MRTARWNILRMLVSLFAIFLVAETASGCFEDSSASRPNIVLILADDLGYGDLGCYNPNAKVATPNLDRLASGGIRFTDAHSPATVCTPSRYSVMTGRMCFRTGYRGGVFTGVGGPSLIEPDRMTLPSMLRQIGYSTACVGKWHIGMTFRDKDRTPIFQTRLDDALQGESREIERVKRVDYGLPITDGPAQRGFDYFFGTACCPSTDWLYAFIENDRIPVPPERKLDASRLPTHPYSRDCRRGWIAPDYDLESLDMVFLEKSRSWLENQVKNHPDQPFFLYHAMQAVHLPSFAEKSFQGKSGAGPHGDFLFEMDHIVGELLKTLERLGVAENTLVLFSSDNGPEVTTTVHMRTDHGHDPAYPWRGVKRDNWEGGHRVPLIASWPKKIAPAVSDRLVCLTDVMATCAAITGVELPENSAEDSFLFLPEAVDDTRPWPQRPYILHQTIKLDLAIRRGPWKYLDHRGSGGNRYDQGEMRPYELPETGTPAPAQLYDLASDPGERVNLYHQQPEIVKELKTLLDHSKASGRSRPPTQ